MPTAYSVRDVIVYTLLRLGGRVRGLKKLVKLVFLVQYEKSRLPLRKSIVKYMVGGKPAVRADFVIWDYGPFSKEIYDVLEDESLFTIADLEPPVTVELTGEGRRLAEEAGERLPRQLARRIDAVVERFGRLSGAKLAEYVYKMIDLTPSLKEEYLGVAVDKYLEDIGIRVKMIELTA
ncbi:MAG: SocA family protein [Crenarchaeota archaeon]|nr:SocA family protein [Thermoproteota archaeon]